MKRRVEYFAIWKAAVTSDSNFCSARSSQILCHSQEGHYPPKENNLERKH